MGTFESKDLLAPYPFSGEGVEAIKNNRYVAKRFPVVYILFDETKMLAYVGESTNAINRLTDHLKHEEKSQLKYFHLISDDRFNKSAALDIEAYLIQTMPGLGFKLQNGNAGIANHNYYEKESYRALFNRIWNTIIFQNVPSRTIKQIENSDIFKYSPYKTLSQDQHQSALEILEVIISGKKTTTFIDGLAGTGKTILAIYVIKLLASYQSYDMDELEKFDKSMLTLLRQLLATYPNGLKIGFVVPMTSLRNTLKTVFRGVYGLSPAMVIGPSDVVKKDYDLLVVDESHRLSRRKGITNFAAHDSTNRKLGLYDEHGDDHGTHLDWIVRSSKLQIFFYDAEQSIRPADVRKADFDALRKQSSSTEIQLTSQMRSRGGKDYIDFVDQLLNCRLPEGTKPYSSVNYDLVLFNSMQDMVSQLRQREEDYGLSRMMSGYSWEWVSRNGTNIPDAIIDGVELTWNRVSKDWINSTTDATEMGCIHTVQGYDLNYAGVIFGEEITYDPTTKRIVVKKDKYFDKKGKVALESDDELHNYIIKIYKTMMFRGILGTYVYACDPGLREYFSGVMVSR